MDDSCAAGQATPPAESEPDTLTDCALAYGSAVREWKAASKAESEAEAEARARREHTAACALRVRRLRTRLDALAETPAELRK